ncbi:sugar transporter [Tessaracoccus rhinocerotis]|uniref:Sugar transporter n=1 Tax=Tessaracoccus rhinocerotis TaxID=1689449 RepID=A0A553JW65_9ACTN|nr:MFS transporter [Tessaracoccus rhinocerotis]TRY16707.1 sugar transporter [Tessaracoccus rhinocerotis]
MARTKKLTASEIDGVDYRRAKTWRIALSQANNGSAMIFYVLVGLMSYLQNAGYGIAVAVAGIILTVTRVLDGIIDPVLAIVMDKVNFRHGKLRFFMLVGWAIRSFAVLLLFVWGSDKGLGPVFFIAVYVVYIIGSSTNDIAGNMIPPVMTNDPKQRPTIQVWATIYAYLVPMLFTIVSTVAILPRHGNEYTVGMLQETALVFIASSLFFQILACVGVSEADKPENFAHITAKEEESGVSLKDMWSVLAHNGPFQRFLISAASDKLAQQVGAQAVVTTMLFGIMLGNIQLGTIMGLITMLPSIVFAIIGARHSGKHGARRSVVTWTWACLAAAVALVVFCLAVDTRAILTSIPLMIGFFGLYLLLNGAKMCVTTASGAMRADIVDHELDRSGKYLPAVVTATYNFIDQIVSSLGAAIALGSVALIGFRTVMPQPNDGLTTSILFVTLALFLGLPVLGWVCTLVAMRGYTLTREEMIEVQRRVSDKKAAVLTGAPEAEAVPQSVGLDGPETLG